MGTCPSKNKSHMLSLPVALFASTKPLDQSDFEQYAQEWNLKSDDIKRACIVASSDKMRVNKVHSPDDKMKCFLYAKGILQKERVLREFDLQNIYSHRQAADPYQRLLRIVSTGECALEALPSFDNFVLRHPAWGLGTSWVLFRDHVLLKGKDAYVERTQCSSLCYMHGSVVMQHLLVSMYRDEKVGMVDITDYLRKHTNGEQLRNHIFLNAGGHSVEFLRSLLQLPNHETFEKPDVKSLEIPELMERYGPALVSSMEIWSCFYNQSLDVHTDSPQGTIVGYHSMVLVGYRQEGNEIRYLLQNWWQRKLFVEVNARYLRACGAILTFCTTRHEAILGGHKMNLNSHVESSNDACEESPLETGKK
jgi:predicted RNA-binding protein